MPVIIREGEDRLRVLDPFYAGEWVLDREATMAYLHFLRRLDGLPVDDSVRTRRSDAHAPGSCREFIDHGLPLACDFDVPKVIAQIDKVQHGIVTPPVPILEVTPACNYRCPWCYVPRDHRSSADIEEIRRKLVAPVLGRGTRVFVLSGGEPSMDLPRLQALCQCITQEARRTETDVKLALLTNGSDLAQNVPLYSRLGISAIQVSVTSVDPQRDRTLRGAPKHANTADDAAAGTRAAVAAGLAVSWNFVLVPPLVGLDSNIPEIPAMVARADELGVHTIRIVPVVPAGEAARNRIALDLHELRRAKRLIAAQAQRHREGLIVYSPIGYDVPATKPVYCRAGNDVLYVNSEGWVYPCNNLICPEFMCSDTPFGDPDILSVWDASPVLARFRTPDDVSPDCAQCDSRAECGGQCRAQIFWRHGTLNLSRRPASCWTR